LLSTITFKAICYRLNVKSIERAIRVTIGQREIYSGKTQVEQKCIRMIEELDEAVFANYKINRHNYLKMLEENSRRAFNNEDHAG